MTCGEGEQTLNMVDVGGWCSSSVQGPYGVVYGNIIKNGWHYFYPFIIFKVEDNSCIKFWCDSLM